MQGQLDEMRKQREFTIAQIRGSLKRERMQYQHINEFGYPVPPTEIFSGWAFNAIWTNVGATAAKNVTSWSSPSIKNRTTEKNWSDVLKRPDHPNVPFSSSGAIVEKGGIHTEVAMNVAKSAIEQATGAHPSVFLYFFGRIQYNDVFPDTPLHYFEWCVLRYRRILLLVIFPFISYTRERAS